MPPTGGISKRAWIDAVYDAGTVVVDLDPFDQRANDFASSLPRRLLQAIAELGGEVLNARQHDSQFSLGLTFAARVVELFLRTAQAPAQIRAALLEVRPLDQSVLVQVDETLPGALNGTPGYVAPEQYEHGTFDARSDQFAFCVSVWEALAGNRPFRGADLEEIEKATLAGEIAEPAKAIRPALRRVLERGLAIDPAARWSSMEALLAALAGSRRSKRLLMKYVSTPSITATRPEASEMNIITHPAIAAGTTAESVEEPEAAANTWCDVVKPLPSSSP